MPASPLPNLPSLLRAIGQAQTKAQRALAFDDLVAVLQATESATPFIRKMVSSGRDGRRIAFEVLIRLPQPIPLDLVAFAGQLLGRRLPSRLRGQAAKTLLEALPTNHDLTSRILESFTKKLAPDAAIRRLQSLQEICTRIEIAGYISKLKQVSEKPCPRCGLRLAPEDFVKHLWAEHRLLYDGQKVREPWEAITSWVNLYQRTNDVTHLERAANLATVIDPEKGATRLNRILLAVGSTDPVAQARLRAEAIRAKAGLCPTCLALVPNPNPLPEKPYLFAAGGTISWDGWKIEVADQGLVTHLRMKQPGKSPSEMAEPKRPFTRRGIVWLFCFPLICISCLGSIFADSRMLPPVLVSGPLIVVALLAYFFIRTRWDRVTPATDRAVDYAWQFLEPIENKNEFLAGLLCVSLKHGDPKVREKPLDKILAGLRSGSDSETPIQLAIELEYQDALTSGEDELLPLSRLAGDCFDGQIPLAILENTLAGIVPKFSPENRSRLRVLLLTQAFRTGLMPLDIRDIGRACPVLGASLASEDFKGISRLYVLFQMRQSRPWSAIGSAATAFDLARYPDLGGEFLTEHPNLLLVQFGSDLSNDESEPSPLLICEDGVIYKQQVIVRDSVIRFRQRSVLRGGGYELYIDDLVWRFKSSPERLKERLEFWRDFLFRNLRPTARNAEGRSGKRDLLLNKHLATCPECRTSFVVIPGEIGIQKFTDDEDL